MTPKHHITDAIVITCIDFRFQRVIKNWLTKRFADQYEFDRVSLAGGVYDLYTVLKQIEISNSLHSIKTVILMNHEQCGAYGESGTILKHQQDLLQAKRIIEVLHPHLRVEAYYIRLDGLFERITNDGKRK